MKYLLVMALLITAFALGVVYGPWVQERVHSISAITHLEQPEPGSNKEVLRSCS